MGRPHVLVPPSIPDPEIHTSAVNTSSNSGRCRSLGKRRLLRGRLLDFYNCISPYLLDILIQHKYKAAKVAYLCSSFTERGCLEVIRSQLCSNLSPFQDDWEPIHFCSVALLLFNAFKLPWCQTLASALLTSKEQDQWKIRLPHAIWDTCKCSCICSNGLAEPVRQASTHRDVGINTLEKHK